MTGKYIEKLSGSKFLRITLIVLLALFLRLFFIFSTDNFSGIIPAQRIVYSQKLHFSPADYKIIDPVVPILFPYLLKLWLQVFPGFSVSPRILSLLFGMLTLFPFYAVVKVLKGEGSAILATFLLAVCPLHIVYSTLSIEEAGFYFIIFCALYLFLKYRFETTKLPGLIFCALLVSCSFGFRFEGALYALILSLFLLAEKNKKNLLIFSALAFFFPLVWGVICEIKFASPLFSYAYQAYFSHLDLPERCNLWCGIEKISRVFSLPFLIFGALGFFNSLKDIKMRLINTLFISFSFIFFFKTSMRTLSWDPKYFFTFGMFLIIYISIGIFYFLHDLKSKNQKLAFIAIFCLYGFLFSIRYISNQDTIKTSFSLPAEIKNITAFFSGLKPERKILVDVDYMNWYPENIIVSSNADVARFEIAEQFDVFGQRIKDGANLDEYKHQLLRRIAGGNFTYIIYAPQGRSLRLITALSAQHEVIGGVKYKKIFSGDIYWVYQLER